MVTLALLGLLGCGPSVEGDGETESAAPGEPVTLTEQETPLATAPGLVILAGLGSDGLLSVGGTVAGETWVDLDQTEDDRWPFRYQVLDADDGLLYEHSTPGPIQVRDFLQYYSDESGYNILEVFPLLGHFPVTVPVLDGADRVRFQIRDAQGTWSTIGSYDLGQSDDVGVSEAVIGSETLSESGPPENALDIVLVGDGYTADEMDLWEEDAARLAADLLETEPMASFSDFINIHRVDAVSAESGASYDCVDECRIRDTAFASVYPMEWVNTLLGTNYNTRSLFQLQQWEVARAVSVVPWDLVIVVVNTTRSGGFSIHYATVTNGSEAFTRTGVHEFGHMLGLLGDEYVSDDCIISESIGLPPNITDSPESPPWADWVDDETPLPTPDGEGYANEVGAFEGAYNCDDLYRPEQACRMKNSSGGDFCAVCAEQLSRRIFRFADPATALSWTQDEAGAAFSAESPRSDLVLSASVGDEDLATGTSEESLFVPAEALAGRAGQTLTVRARLDSEFVLDGSEDLEQVWTFSLDPAASP